MTGTGYVTDGFDKWGTFAIADAAPETLVKKSKPRKARPIASKANVIPKTKKKLKTDLIFLQSWYC